MSKNNVKTLQADTTNVKVNACKGVMIQEEGSDPKKNIESPSAKESEPSESAKPVEIAVEEAVNLCDKTLGLKPTERNSSKAIEKEKSPIFKGIQSATDRKLETVKDFKSTTAKPNDSNPKKVFKKKKKQASKPIPKITSMRLQMQEMKKNEEEQRQKNDTGEEFEKGHVDEESIEKLPEVPDFLSADLYFRGWAPASPTPGMVTNSIFFCWVFRIDTSLYMIK